MLQEFELRKHARQEGRRYCDPMVLTYQAERMPEQIRLKVRLPVNRRVLVTVSKAVSFWGIHVLDD